jgi:hypothetical protein
LDASLLDARTLAAHSTNVSEYNNQTMVVMPKESIGPIERFDGPGKCLIPVGNADSLPAVSSD